MIGIVDLEISNITSVITAFNHIGCKTRIINTPDNISDCEGIVLPGVGAFADGIKALENKNLIEPIIKYTKEGMPILGICLGMQLMASQSEEFGTHKGLNLISGKVTRLEPTLNERVPNIGWCDVNTTAAAKIFENIQDKTSFYFVHSYHLNCKNDEESVATINYGHNLITVAIQKDNILGLQFHPEKSQDAGLRVLNSFISIVRNKN